MTVENKKQLTSDVEKLFQIKLLKQKLNELKKVNEYKVILDEIDSVFEHFELLFNDNFEINSGEVVEGSYIGNVVVDYNIVTNYKGLNDVEKFKQFGALKYTSTESESFKNVGDVMYKNIAKDMFISQKTQKYVNLKWSDIKGAKQDYEAYVNSNAELKKYYNDSEDFHQALLKLLKDKYFKLAFPTLDISYSKRSIYRSNDFLVENKEYLIMNNFDKENAIKLKEGQDTQTISKILLGDEVLIKETLKSQVFNLRALQKYRVAQDEFLNKFLNSVEFEKYNVTDSYYDLAVAMGYADFVAPVIGVGVAGGSSYQYKLPDFKLAISYSMNGENDEISESFIDLSLKLFGVYKELWNPYEINESSFLFKVWYKNKGKIWVYKDKINNFMTGKEINLDLNNYQQFYFVELEKAFSLLDMTRNVFKSLNVLYSINMKNYDLRLSTINFNSSNEYKWTFFAKRKVAKDELIFYEEINYLQFDLFGIVEMDIYFDEQKLTEYIF
ncbi:hypothetical protein [Spiroplasma endosymbiont of Atherix ibis]|uniref:hypothetical protein n=1 Tax=Spiroplasma endosymbiont of Atherix ibis TaxID=3066291 RepID=UPI0030CD7BF9